MEFFSGEELSSFIADRSADLEEEIQGLSDQQINGCDIEEWTDYFVSKYYIEPIVLFENNIEQEIAEKIIKQYNIWAKYSPFESEFFNVDGYSIAFRIPFDGNAKLLHLQPPTRIISHFPYSALTAPCGDALGSFIISIEIPKDELKTHLENIDSFVTGQFEGRFKKYRQMIDYINIGIKSFNNNLHIVASGHLLKRKEKANDFMMISRALNIPLKRSNNAPIVTPVPLKRIARTPAKKPIVSVPEPEYSISDEDYNNILNIIHSTCISMEATARTFVKNDEEELRDFIIATLGTHYENAVSGETFRRIGKTDIHIIFENKAAFIGECKIWHGIKKFKEAIDQLNGYSTWKDTKSAIILFNKDNKDFSSIRKKLDGWIKDNVKSYKMKNGSMWECIIHQNDSNNDIKLAIAVYDITV